MNGLCFTMKNFGIFIGSMMFVFVVSLCLSTVGSAQDNEVSNNQSLQAPESTELAAPGVPSAPEDAGESIDLGVPGVPDNSDAPDYTEASDDLGVPGVPNNSDAPDDIDTSGDLGVPGAPSET
jgi:hypothetical protein